MKYTESHEWIEVMNGIGTVGVTDHAQKELGDIVYVELPKIGKNVKAGEEVAVLESTKAAADVYSPVSGTIYETNASLSQASEKVNQSPEAEGWLFKIKLNDLNELNQLLNADAYLSMLPKNK
jgi:glycine cleavage system H protein